MAASRPGQVGSGELPGADSSRWPNSWPNFSTEQKPLRAMPTQTKPSKFPTHFKLENKISLVT